MSFFNFTSYLGFTKKEEEIESEEKKKNQDLEETEVKEDNPEKEDLEEEEEDSDIDKVEKEEVEDPTKGVILENGEYLERGIIFSKKPIRDPKYKRQIIIGGTGGLLNYMLGVTQIIKENFDLSDTLICGSSGGCTSALYLALPPEFIEVDDFLDHHTDHFFCREYLDLFFGGLIGCPGRPNYASEIFLKKILEHYYPNEETREQEILDLVHGRFFVSTTKMRNLGNYVINHWESVDDLINSIVSSMTIPIWSQWTISRAHKQYWLFDGGLSNATPQIFMQIPTLILECAKWRQFGWLDYYPVNNYDDHSRFKRLGMKDALEHLRELEGFFEQTAKCRSYLNDPEHPFNEDDHEKEQKHKKRTTNDK